MADCTEYLSWNEVVHGLVSVSFGTVLLRIHGEAEEKQHRDDHFFDCSVNLDVFFLPNKRHSNLVIV